MNILVINSGSSSIKFSAFVINSATETMETHSALEGELSAIGESAASLDIRNPMEGRAPKAPARVDAPTVEAAIHLVFNAVCRDPKWAPDAVGYRVVHPGAKLHDHQRITPAVLQDLEEAAAFAPLHDPTVVRVIREGLARFPQTAHYACFDTVFHQTMPEEATTYALPRAFRDQGMRRYGFHGLSCESIVRSMRATGMPLPRRMVIAHLGSGCSVTALLDGSSVDTSMGMTPTGGIVMGTRPGDLDPGVVLYLLRQQHGTDAVGAVEAMLNHDAGLVALSGQPNDMKAIRQAAAGGDKHALLALRIFTRSVAKSIGSYCWLLGGLDAIVFSGGIGEHDAHTRSETLARLEQLGVDIDATTNIAHAAGIRTISKPESKTQVFVVPAQEDLMIALHVDRMHHAQ